MRNGPSGGSQGNPLGMAIVGAIAIIVVIVALTVLFGCAKPPVRGTVSHLQHSDAYSYPTTYCAAYNSKGNCIVYATHWNYMPPSWEVCVNGTDEDGKQASGCIEVGERTWHSYREGDDYPKNTR